MNAISRSVANLARLELSEEEVATFSDQLTQVLGYIDQLQSVPESSLGEPLYHPIDLPTLLREDRAAQPQVDTEGRPVMLSAASQTDGVIGTAFKVPPIL
ncbi:Asp-tRNA(Asn)/Glu-tRNA(Gln) amidotransferase subunit GatC [Bdellovibrionota bacterium FG-2]